jgi:hypothetical protein
VPGHRSRHWHALRRGAPAHPHRARGARQQHPSRARGGTASRREHGAHHRYGRDGGARPRPARLPTPSHSSSTCSSTASITITPAPKPPSSAAGHGESASLSPPPSLPPSYTAPQFTLHLSAIDSAIVVYSISTLNCGRDSLIFSPRGGAQWGKIPHLHRLREARGCC